jgi:hypothetical protein
MRTILLVLVSMFGLFAAWQLVESAYAVILRPDQFLGAEGVFIRNPTVRIVVDLTQSILIVFFLATALIKKAQFYWNAYAAVVIACVLFLAFEFWYNNILRGG